MNPIQDYFLNLSCTYCTYPFLHVVVALVQTSAYAAQGSAFYHGSETTLGADQDVKFIDLFTYLAYQASTADLGPPDSTVLHELSTEPRSRTAFETTAYLQDLFLNQDLTEWNEGINDLDVPSIFLGMCAFFATPLSLMLEEDKLEPVIEAILIIMG